MRYQQPITLGVFKRCYSREPTPRTEDEQKLINDFFAMLSQSRVTKSANTHQHNFTKDSDNPLVQMSYLLSDFAHRKKIAGKEETAEPQLLNVDELHASTTFSPKVLDLLKQVLRANDGLELQIAITRVVKHPSLQEADPRLLAAIIAQCRRKREPFMAASLVNKLKQASIKSYVAWFDTNVYNELIYMDWVLHGDLHRTCEQVTEMCRDGLPLNEFSEKLLWRIRDDIGAEKCSDQDKATWNGLVNAKLPNLVPRHKYHDLRRLALRESTVG